MVRESVFLIQIDASSFAEFEISEFEISRVDCTGYVIMMVLFLQGKKEMRYCLEPQTGGLVWCRLAGKTSLVVSY